MTNTHIHPPTIETLKNPGFQPYLDIARKVYNDEFQEGIPEPNYEGLENRGQEEFLAVIIGTIEPQNELLGLRREGKTDTERARKLIEGEDWRKECLEYLFAHIED
ncbi:hypothetical protein CL618_03390 [archaeon]|mgnify:CR=1 FL=1|nr:hypothetical protein [archaeon]|tara:strand:+ start:2455 stop:2772 length:318 start_codon:yes stop_codon:yes gene_type:complete